MSEYQYVEFIALDRPLDEKQLDYMETQSSRAEITKWRFTNEYHFGDFHGNANEMLRRGYDAHLHYANFGVRRLMFRLPAGLPWDRKTIEAYFPEYGLHWHPDKQGAGGTLEIAPETDGGAFDDSVFEIDELLEQIAPVRDLLIAGDLRPLYVIWLAMSALHGADGSMEPPLPAGMGSLPDCITALADFYELSDELLQVAAEGSAPMPKSTQGDTSTTQWLARQSKDELKNLVERFLLEDAMSVRTETLAAIRKESGSVTWPTTRSTRTFGELCGLADELESQRNQREAEAKEKARRAKLKKMAADPEQVITEVEKLVMQRSRPSYSAAATTLVELGEALGADGANQVREVAERLRRSHPNHRACISELKRHGLLGKKK